MNIEHQLKLRLTVRESRLGKGFSARTRNSGVLKRITRLMKYATVKEERERDFESFIEHNNIGDALILMVIACNNN